VSVVKTFAEGVAELQAWVGDAGPLTGHVVVDQVYAHFQHEVADEIYIPTGRGKHKDITRVLKHPRGGGANYLGGPLYENVDVYLELLADAVLPSPVGDDLGRMMMECMKDLAGDGGVRTHAPAFFGILRESGHPFVTSDGAVIHDSVGHAPRLTDATIDAMWTLPNRDWRWD
jgi:hypothetical protein